LFSGWLADVEAAQRSIKKINDRPTKLGGDLPRLAVAHGSPRMSAIADTSLKPTSSWPHA